MSVDKGVHYDFFTTAAPCWGNDKDHRCVKFRWKTHTCIFVSGLDEWKSKMFVFLTWADFFEWFSLCYLSDGGWLTVFGILGLVLFPFWYHVGKSLSTIIDNQNNIFHAVWFHVFLLSCYSFIFCTLNSNIYQLPEPREESTDIIPQKDLRWNTTFQLARLKTSYFFNIRECTKPPRGHGSSSYRWSSGKCVTRHFIIVGPQTVSLIFTLRGRHLRLQTVVSYIMS